MAVVPSDPDSALTGRTWLFPERNINTDLLMPADVFGKSVAVQVRAVLENLRPGWSQVVRPGDMMVVGPNFGTGSGRPAAWLLTKLGVTCVVAESVNDLFFRNAINAGLPVVTATGATATFHEGEDLHVDLLTGIVSSTTRPGISVQGTGLPAFLMSIVARGGLAAALREDGLIE